jgi:hypothetical protein
VTTGLSTRSETRNSWFSHCGSPIAARFIAISGRRTVLQTTTTDRRVDLRHLEWTARPRTTRWTHSPGSPPPGPTTPAGNDHRNLAQRPHRPTRPTIPTRLRQLTLGISHLVVIRAHIVSCPLVAIVGPVWVSCTTNADRIRSPIGTHSTGSPLCQGAAFPHVDGAPVLAAVKKTARERCCGAALGQGVGNAARTGPGQGPGGVTPQVGGFGKWLFRSAGVGRDLVALESVAVPRCPPGP